MAATALRVKSEEDGRLARDSDFGLAHDRFINPLIHNLFLAFCPAGNQSRRMRRGIEHKGFIGEREVFAEEIDETRNEPPSHVALRNIVALRMRAMQASRGMWKDCCHLQTIFHPCVRSAIRNGLDQSRPAARSRTRKSDGVMIGMP